MNCEFILAHLFEITPFIRHFACGTMENTQSGCNDIEQVASGTVLMSMDMEHLEPFRPRWVQASNVDTPAMYVAALMFRDQHPQKWKALQLEGNLTIIEHRSWIGSPANNEKTFRSRPCTKVGCDRCYAGNGGYVFRWYSKLWEKAYIENARPNAWRPGESEEDA